MTSLSLVLVAALLTCLKLTSASSISHYCGPPDSPSYGGFFPQKKFYPIGKTVEFFCNKGFILVGQRWTVCIFNRKTGKIDWAHPSPVCKRIECPGLPNPQYGSVKLSGTTPGSTATYTCNFGFRLEGQTTRNCQNDGEWNGKAPVCIAITCPDLPNPQYGSVELTGNRVGDKANYKCDFGFELKGQSQRKCLISGGWNGNAPICVVIKCPDLPDPQYGSVKLTGNRVGDKANYKCDFGFELKGQSQRKCLISGDWSGDAPICVPITCPDLPNPQYGSVELTGNRVGDKANYRCDFGFELKGQSQRKCLISGDWSGDAPICIPITCPDLPNPQYGSVELTGNRVGDKANYKCDFGFELKGQSQRKCLISGGWSGNAPICVPITCPDLPNPQYGSVELTGNRVGDKANYKCDFGFELKGQSQRKCQITGDWSGDAPICVPITCPDLPNPQYGSVKLTGNRVGDKANYKCDFGFELKGQSQRKCQITGDWSGDAPICVPITCPDLPNPQFGSVELTGNRVGDKANYRCDFGFRLKGQSQRKCLISGDWSGDAPTCVPITCPNLPDPQYGSVKLTGNRVGDKANYKCDFGFRLKGQSQRKCLISGDWSGNAPTCVRITCPDLDDPDYGSVKLSGNTPGSKAEYRCNRGFKLVGVSWRRCKLNGVWTGTAPTCRRLADCGKPGAPKYGYVKFSSTTEGSKAYYSCPKGFVLKGNRVRVCQSNKYWSGSVPVCLPRYH